MGCTSSKSARRHSHRNMPADHHITLKSCTLGSLKLDRDVVSLSDEAILKKASNDCVKPEMKPMTPCNQPEIINAWELMEGLEDVTPLRTPSAATLEHRSMSFSVAGSSLSSSSRFIMNHRDSSFSEFDPEVVSTFRKTLVELSPQHRQLLRSPEPEKMASRVLRSRYMQDDESCRKTPDLTGIVRARIMEFQERIESRKVLKVQQSFKSWLGMGGGGRVVVYLTSLRGIRETYNECKEVREILRSYRLRVDERDVSMHRGFKEELNEVLGFEYGGRRLPAVFVKGEYLGGVEEVRRLHEDGELGKVVEGCELMMAGKNGGGGGECEECGEVRFVLCGRCSGSCKVFVQKDSGDGGGGGGGFWCRCLDCNENGIVRCPLCC